ncbi:MAG: LLM class flavin-dependent oxidoreductase, partial [Actinomycetes bacterium]
MTVDSAGTAARRFELGLNSFGDVATTGPDRRVLTDPETIRLLIEEATLAESVGLDLFSIGEHYRQDHTDSATPVLLAAIARDTERIGLGTSVTVLSTNDPVRLYQDFATVDAVSNGRARLVLGRASVTESFALFGFDLAEYEALFEEKLDLFMRLQREEAVTWQGRFRAPLSEERLRPRMPTGGIPTWIGVGGSPDSVVRAAHYGLPLMFAIIGGKPERFAGHVELYRRALEQAGHPEQPIAQHSLGLIAPTDAEAVDTYWPSWQPVVESLSKERGFYAPTRERFERELDDGAMFVGSPETVAQKIARVARGLHLSRFDLKYDLIHLPVDARRQSIELYGREVAPRVRELLASDPVVPWPSSR